MASESKKEIFVDQKLWKIAETMKTVKTEEGKPKTEASLKKQGKVLS